MNKKMKSVKFKDLTKEQKRLLMAAEKTMETAYNPYSKFFVGAALLTRDNKIITGSNVENAAYGSTICAERAAILRANALGKRCFKSIAIIARGENFDTKEVTGPCGACRQVLLEFSQISETDLTVIMSTTKKDKIVVASISELLPLNFGPKDLGIDIQRYQK